MENKKAIIKKEIQEVINGYSCLIKESIYTVERENYFGDKLHNMRELYNECEEDDYIEFLIHEAVRLDELYLGKLDEIYKNGK